MDVQTNPSTSALDLTQRICDIEDKHSEFIAISDNLGTAARKAAVVLPPKQTIDPTKYNFKLAPEVKPVRGTYDVACIGIKWLDNPGPDLNILRNMGQNVAGTYGRLSGKLVTLRTAPYRVVVNLKRNANNLTQAENAGKVLANKAKTTPGRYDYYLIVNSGAKQRSNAGGDTAHLLNPRGFTANHELGHLAPFKLEHAAAVIKGRVVGSKDVHSFMSNYGSNLTSSQLRNLGWLPNKVAQYGVGSRSVEIPMEYLLNEKSIPGFMKAVRIPATGGGADLYLSVVERRSNKVFALHKSYGVNNKDDSAAADGGGGSILIGIFGDKFQYKALRFSKTADDGRNAVIKIETDPTPMPPITKKK